MRKIEHVYRELLFKCIEKKTRVFTQLAIAKTLHISISTVNHALLPLRNMGAIEVHTRNFKVIDITKLLYHWASMRNLKKDTIYQTRVEKPVKKIESEMPQNATFAVYSSYKLMFKDVPADYSEVYMYADLEEIQKRFPKSKGQPNLFILNKDEFMNKYGKTTSIAQTFVDLWNLQEWYAKEFVLALQKRIEEMI